MNKDVDVLKYYAHALGRPVETVASVLLNDERFPIWWGGLNNQHHNFTGGLAKHTREVVEMCYNTEQVLSLTVDRVEVYLSALFHDAGKMYDYEIDVDNTYVKTNPTFKATEHKRKIHHISRSALIWSHAAERSPEIKEKYHDSVLHAILAHHGERAWGSPVAPKSRVAWMVHLCDNLSARMNDCDRLDLIKEKKV